MKTHFCFKNQFFNEKRVATRVATQYNPGLLVPYSADGTPGSLLNRRDSCLPTQQTGLLSPYSTDRLPGSLLSRRDSWLPTQQTGLLAPCSTDGLLTPYSTDGTPGSLLSRRDSWLPSVHDISKILETKSC